MNPVENGVPDINKDVTSEEIVSIDLFGRQFQFRADDALDDPGKVVEKLKQYVARAEQGMEGSVSVQNSLVVLLLAGMNMANDLAASESELLEFHECVDHKSTALLNKLNAFASNAG
ncbi:hypothetical protein SAMN02746065_1025 [Desulfocicer vacuolatum DSM 3385]|uniref:Cell division protein ZapA n=1 Tax=Desulfocicer vacuolatum DSM 3385 TaxID=1121400 RepID=A0A1W1YZ33_9BACT|nr:hypothetical protein [Desulfocicer vacuolatum]SMC41460.1 hypothetical protein SAMN02746065_1025 [Desulfocicer vacuolatum DSM 3385]